MNIIVHIGFHKTGTTWLQKNIFEVLNDFNLINDYVEPWNDDIIKYLIKSNIKDFDPIYFKSLVSKKISSKKINVISSERISGHPSSGGFDSKNILNKIYKCFPDSKIIVVTREKEEFKLSTYKQLVKEGYTMKFSDYSNNNFWKICSPTDFYFDNANIVNIYKKTFKKVLVLSFDEFKSNKLKFVEKILQFCGSEYDELQIDQSYVNYTFPNNRIRALRFLNKFKQSEFNNPLIKINDKFLYTLSYYISFIFSNNRF